MYLKNGWKYGEYNVHLEGVKFCCSKLKTFITLTVM